MSWLEPRARSGHSLRVSQLKGHRWNTPMTAAEGDSFFVNWADRPGVTALGSQAVAYTNNDANAATGTVLYALNNGIDQLLIQAPPNAGTQNQVGALGVDIDAQTGFDIFTVVNGAGVVTGARALASMSTTVMGATTTRLYEVNLTTGAATPVLNGNFANTVITGLAIPPIQGM